MKLDLRKVTLCAVDHVAHELTRFALERCLAHADFADVIVCSDRDILPGSYHVRTHVEDSTEAEVCINYVLPAYVKTDHYLYIQWDSWIINPAIWSDDWLQYDYIGAPWPDEYLWPNCNKEYNIGNGGFSLRSMRLAGAMRAASLYDPERHGKNVTNTFYSPEDHAVCVGNRERLETAGCKWPSAEVAKRFSAELKWPDLGPGCRPFGFHGAFNFACVLEPWEFNDLMRHAPPYVLEGNGIRQMRKVINGEIARGWDGPLKPGWI